MPERMYYSLAQDENEATINIFGDIMSWPWEYVGEVSNYNLSKKLEEFNDVSKINVYINSYGGEVAEGLAIYNALKRHKAKIVTHCDGFACSIASVIFMAGDERLMSDASLLMIHNAWSYVNGNAAEMRKAAEDLDTITSASVAAYMSGVNITESEVRKLMDNESWILPTDAVEMGFATGLVGTTTSNPSQSARELICRQLTGKQQSATDIEQMIEQIKVAVKEAAKEAAAEVFMPPEPDIGLPETTIDGIYDGLDPSGFLMHFFK